MSISQSANCGIALRPYFLSYTLDFVQYLIKFRPFNDPMRGNYFPYMHGASMAIEICSHAQIVITITSPYNLYTPSRLRGATVISVKLQGPYLNRKFFKCLLKIIVTLYICCLWLNWLSIHITLKRFDITVIKNLNKDWYFSLKI
jgi:hypothetical protein